ncbi:hypothetical protein TL16_g01589 [Triparma laevis f. inornata]|uniref:Uncharacterized protein n=1 Tax=Triparma laevis f. inornata TaxID=1714386 RepID=A0A9W6ZGN9_9STRA|nr:hypothetical protein TL16_g01589 [Triparma laevis f. inornata]
MAKVATTETTELGLPQRNAPVVNMKAAMNESTYHQYTLLLQQQEELEGKIMEMEREHFGGSGAAAAEVPEQRRIANTLRKLRMTLKEEEVIGELKFYNESATLLQKQMEYDEMSILGDNVQKWLSRREEQDEVKVKISYERGREKLREKIMDVVDSWIELLNEFGSAFFIFSTLRQLENQLMFQVSLSFLVFNLFARLAIGLRNYGHVDDGKVVRADLETGYVEKRFKTGDSKKGKFWAALLVFMVEPSSGRKMIKETLRKTKSLKNSDGTTHDLHPVALKMLGLYLSARNEIQTSLSITLCADIPELVVELIYILAFAGTGEGAGTNGERSEPRSEVTNFSFWFSIAGTIAHLARQGVELRYDGKHLPELQVESSNVDVTFKKGSKGEEVEEWAKKHGGVCRVLTLTNCKDVGDKAAAVIARYCGKLEKLSAADTSIGNEGATLIAKSSPGLQKCFVNGTNVDDEGAAIIAKHCKDLKMFALSRTQFSDKGARSIAMFCKGLNVLGVNTSELTDEGCRCVAEGCKKLHTFKFADTKVGDDGVISAVKGLPFLVTLHLFGNELTDQCCEDIGVLKGLKELHLGDTKVGDSGLRTFFGVNTSLERLFVGGTNVSMGGFLDAEVEFEVQRL